MFRRLDNDSLLQIALELVSDSRATLIPFIQSNRHLYNLASHYLLLGTSNDPFTHVHVDLEGNTKMDECVEGFRDFVLGVTSYRSRIRHLRKLLLTTPSQEEIMDLEHPRLSTRAIAALTEIFNPAPSYKSAVSMDLPVLEIFAMDPEPLAMLDNTLPLAEALFKLTTIKEMVYTTCWTSNIIRLHQEIKAPLHKLSINIDDPLTHSYKDNLLLYLAPLRNSLRDLRLDFRERPTFDLVKGTSSPSFLLMSVLHIQALDFRIPTKVLALAFPHLSELVLQIEKSVYPFDDTSHDEDPVWGMPPEDSYYQTLRRDNHKDGTTLWKGLDILQGSVRTVYSLGLTCQVKTLRLLSDGLDDDVMAREVCSTVQPQTLHLACGLPCAVLLATSTIMGSSVSLTNFYLETALSVEVCEETCWETTRDTITGLFSELHSILPTTDAKTFEILIRLGGVWHFDEWKFRELDNIIDTKDFSPMQCFFYYFLDISPETFVVETMERLRKIDRLRIRIQSYVDPTRKGEWPGMEWNLEENIVGRGLPLANSTQAAKRSLQLEKYSVNEELFTEPLSLLGQ